MEGLAGSGAWLSDMMAPNTQTHKCTNTTTQSTNTNTQTHKSSLDGRSGGIWSVAVRYDGTSSPLEVHISIVPKIKDNDNRYKIHIYECDNRPVCCEERKVCDVLRLLFLESWVDEMR